jgi:hypothetical protein
VEAVFGRDKVAINGAPLSKYRHISDESGRWLDLEFCPSCGTTIGFTLQLAPAVRIIDSGTFDEPGWIRADRHHFRHIFLRSAQDWSEVPDGVERYEKHFLKD